MFDELNQLDVTLIKQIMSENYNTAMLIRAFCKENDLLNEQYYLDWEDKLNKLSVKDPNE